jgi:hypothetical protein
MKIWKNKDSILWHIFVWLFWIAVGSSPFVFAVYLGVNTQYVEADWTMQSVQREASVEGSFFLGSGSINQRMYYISYIKARDGGTYLKAFPASCSVVYEGHNEAYVTFKEDYSLLRNWFSVDPPSVHPSRFSDRMDCASCGCRGTEYKIYVPYGTVIKEFELR